MNVVIRFGLGVLLFGVAFSVLAAPPAPSPGCLGFGGLAPAFIAKLSLVPKTARVQMTPLELGPDTSSERRGYLLADLGSCGMSGDCDSMIYVLEDGKCYRPVLAFRGKWKRVIRRPGRALGSLEIESRFEGESVRRVIGPRIERRVREFAYEAASARFEEVK